MRTVITAISVLSMAIMSGCQSPDVGQPCQLDGAPQSVAADVFESGRAECDALVCIQSAAPGADAKAQDIYCTQSSGGVQCRPYCSKACVSNADCDQDETGLECRDVVLDEAFINSLDPAIRQQFLGPSPFSKYCALPLP